MIYRKNVIFWNYILQSAVRKFADGSDVATLKGGENILHLSLQKHFPLAKEIKIKDISGNYVLMIHNGFCSSIKILVWCIIMYHLWLMN